MSNLMSYEEFLKSDKAVKDDSKYGNKKNREYYQQYVAEHSAELNKKQTLKTLESDKNTALRESDIATERAKRYLNALSLQNGMQGTGYAAAKASDLYAQEASRRTEINNTYNTQKNSVLGAYQSAITQAQATTAQNIATIEDEQEQEKQIDRQEVLLQLDSNKSLYESGEIDYKTYSDYYNTNKHLLDPSKDSTIMSVYENSFKENTEIESSTVSRSNIPEYSFEGLGNGRKNDNIHITIGGYTYHVETGESADESIVEKLNELATGDASTSPTLGSGEGWAKNTKGSNADSEQRLVVYNGKLYMYTKKGWKIIRDRDVAFGGTLKGDTQKIINAFLNPSSIEKPEEILTDRQQQFLGSM